MRGKHELDKEGGGELMEQRGTYRGSLEQRNGVRRLEQRKTDVGKTRRDERKARQDELRQKKSSEET